ncbi:MAG: hypothetical protein EBE86_033760 [Hormoscilla sp. GUM202]|nr:hypothetical protein [Hormoscilla sp. GUM202]
MDYLPRRESEFKNWETNFLNRLRTHQDEFGLTGEELDALSNMQSNWQTAYSDHLNAQSAALGARQKKDNLYKDYQSALRRIVRKLQVNDKVTEDHKVSLGMTVPTESRTRFGPPTTRPMARIEMGQRLQHTIHFMDEATPTRRGKPFGISGCEIWFRLGITLPKTPKNTSFWMFLAPVLMLSSMRIPLAVKLPITCYAGKTGRAIGVLGVRSTVRRYNRKQILLVHYYRAIGIFFVNSKTKPVGSTKVLTTNLGSTKVLTTNLGSTKVLTTNLGSTKVLTTNLRSTKVLTTNLGSTKVLTTNLGSTLVLTTNALHFWMSHFSGNDNPIELCFRHVPQFQTSLL